MNSKTVSDYLKMTLTETALKAWLTSMLGANQANQIVSSTNSVGNYALLVDDTSDNTKAWWFYILKD